MTGYQPYDFLWRYFRDRLGQQHPFLTLSVLSPEGRSKDHAVPTAYENLDMAMLCCEFAVPERLHGSARWWKYYRSMTEQVWGDVLCHAFGLVRQNIAVPSLKTRLGHRSCQAYYEQHVGELDFDGLEQFHEMLFRALLLLCVLCEMAMRNTINGAECGDFVSGLHRGLNMKWVEGHGLSRQCVPFMHAQLHPSKGFASIVETVEDKTGGIAVPAWTAVGLLFAMFGAVYRLDMPDTRPLFSPPNGLDTSFYEPGLHPLWIHLDKRPPSIMPFHIIDKRMYESADHYLEVMSKGEDPVGL